MARQQGASSFVAIPLSVLQAEIASLPTVPVGQDEQGNPIEEPAVMVGKTWWEKLQIAKLRSGQIYSLKPAVQVAASADTPALKDEDDAEEADDHKIEFEVK